MTADELDKARTSVGQLRGYQKGQPPSLPESFPGYVQRELGQKVAPTIQNLIKVIQTLDARLRDLEGS